MPKPSSKMDAFGDIVQHCGFSELPLKGLLFTWHRGRGPNMVLERLEA